MHRLKNKNINVTSLISDYLPDHYVLDNIELYDLLDGTILEATVYRTISNEYTNKVTVRDYIYNEFLNTIEIWETHVSFDEVKRGRKAYNLSIDDNSLLFEYDLDEFQHSDFLLVHEILL